MTVSNTQVAANERWWENEDRERGLGRLVSVESGVGRALEGVSVEGVSPERLRAVARQIVSGAVRNRR